MQLFPELGLQPWLEPDSTFLSSFSWLGRSLPAQSFRSIRTSLPLNLREPRAVHEDHLRCRDFRNSSSSERRSTPSRFVTIADQPVYVGLSVFMHPFSKTSMPLSYRFNLVSVLYEYLAITVVGLLQCIPASRTPMVRSSSGSTRVAKLRSRSVVLGLLTPANKVRVRNYQFPS